jgi:hypothetical protein
MTEEAIPHHRWRTFFASLFGTLAVSLVLSSLVIVWLNRTLTNTSTYVKTVAPLAHKPEIQTFIAQKATDAIVKSAPLSDLATALIPGQNTDKSVDQIKNLLQPVVYDNVLKVVQSPAFAQLWQNTNQMAQAALVSQLSSNSSMISLDLSPLVTGVVGQLKTTQLAAVSDQIDVKPDAAKISRAQQYYQNFQRATWALVATTLVLLVLAVVISVHHLKTLRRILFGTGILSLLLAFSIWASSYITVGNNSDLATKNAIVAIVQTLLHSLQLASLILGIGCIVTAVALKVYTKFNQTPPSSPKLN